MVWSRRVKCNLLALLLVAACGGYPTTTVGQTESTFEEAYRALRTEHRPQYDVSPLKRENPEVLRVDYDQHGECPFSAPSIDEMIDGIIVRSRLKPTRAIDFDTNPGLFKLWVVVECRSGSGEKPPYLFGVRTRFYEVATLVTPRGLVQASIAHVPLIGGGRGIESSDGYGTYGFYHTKTAPDFLRNAIRDSVEDALTDYLKANFDL